MISVAAAPSVFDVFNARQLTPEQVAHSFVPPPYFLDLAQATHTLIIGPRGSGKTTLLKMLHPAALEAWGHPKEATYRERIAYTGVFIATDITWNEQVRLLGDGRLDEQSHHLFSKAAFTTEILHSLSRSMRWRTGQFGPPARRSHRRVHLPDQKENDIAREIADAWRLSSALPSLEGLDKALVRRFSEIKQLASQEAYRDENRRLDRLAEVAYLHLDFLSAASYAVNLFDEAVNDNEAKWALLFDELELAPQWIRRVLVRSLRSVSERFLFKISLSPYAVDLKHELDGVDSARAGQDFTPIKLWYVHKEDGYPFCRELLNSILSAQGKPRVSPETIFGSSSFDTERAGRGPKTVYRSQSELGRLFTFLAERDHTFRDYLVSRRINPAQLELVDSQKRPSDLRKVRSIAALRAYFRGAEGDPREPARQARRSRKIPTVYGGATSLFAMVEGNPRWFIAIVGRLLSNWDSRQIAKPVQVRAVTDAANIFRAMLKTVPCGAIGESRRGLLSLLNPIGECFSNAAIDAPFDPDPPCSFIVDSKTGEDEARALGKALNAGAIVYAPDESDVGLLETVIGKRFRLSYILAPHYCVPLVLGRSMALQTILKRSARAQVDPGPEPTLFSPSE